MPFRGCWKMSLLLILGLPFGYQEKKFYMKNCWVMNTILVILQQFEAVKHWIGINYTKYLLRALNYPQPECKWLNKILSCTQLQAMNRPEGSVHFLSGLRAIIIFSPTGKVRFLDTWYLIETFSIIRNLSIFPKSIYCLKILSKSKTSLILNI